VFCSSLPPRDGVRDASVTLKQYTMVVSRCSAAIYSPVAHQPSRTKPTEPMAEQLLGRRLDAPVTGVGDPEGQNVAGGWGSSAGERWSRFHQPLGRVQFLSAAHRRLLVRQLPGNFPWSHFETR
jgi:hypothetical protein